MGFPYMSVSYGLIGFLLLAFLSLSLRFISDNFSANFGSIRERMKRYKAKTACNTNQKIKKSHMAQIFLIISDINLEAEMFLQQIYELFRAFAKFTL